MHSKQRLSSFPSLIFNLIYNNFPTVVIFCSTTPLLARHNNFHLSRFLFPPMRTFFFVFHSNTAAHTLKMSPRPFNLQPSIFSSVCLSLALSHFLFLSSAFYLFHTLIFLAASLLTHFRLSCLQNSGHKDCDVQYAELDTAALASSPSPRSSAHTGPGDLVEYATIQPSSH